MSTGVTIRRRIAAEREAALLTRAEVDPLATRFDALFAFPAPGANDVLDALEMSTALRHLLKLSSSRRQ
jgi:hypothetical protein